MPECKNLNDFFAAVIYNLVPYQLKGEKNPKIRLSLKKN